MGQPDLSGNFRGYQESNIIQKFKNSNVNNGTTKKVIQQEQQTFICLYSKHTQKQY